MKYTKYLLLLLLAASCASQRSVRHHSYQADRQPVQPAVVQQPVAVQEEEAVLEPEVVASARPLVSQKELGNTTSKEPSIRFVNRPSSRPPSWDSTYMI